MKIIALLLLLVFVLPAVAADKVYKRVNPDGTVEYSDQPFDGSEELQLEEAPAIKFEKSPSIGFKPSTRQDQDNGDLYSVNITSPGNDETIRDNTGNVTLQGQVEPGLRGGHRLRWVMDGEPLSASGQSVSLTNVDRGTHTVRLEVVNQHDEVIASSDSITFHLLRYSVKQPSPPSGSPPTPTNPPKPTIPGPTPTNPPKPTTPSSNP